MKSFARRVSRGERWLLPERRRWRAGKRRTRKAARRRGPMQSAATSTQDQEENMAASKPGSISRRSLLMAATAVPLCGILTRPASAAEYAYKFATGQDPTHPVNIRAQEAIDRIREAASGRLEIRLFPANQLGSDTELLTQVRSGGVEFFSQSSSIPATLVPSAGIDQIPASHSPTTTAYGRPWTAISAPTSGRRSPRRRSWRCRRPGDNGFRRR